MSANIYALLCILLFFVCIYYIYGGMVKSIVKWSRKPVTGKNGKQVQPKLSAADTIKCYIPLYQACYLRKALYHSYGPFAVIASASAVCILIRIINMLVPINANILFITVLLMYLGVILHILLYAIPTAAITKMYGYSYFTVILSFLFPHFMALFLAGGISSRMMALRKEEVFSEKNGDTYIQQRTDKREGSGSISSR